MITCQSINMPNLTIYSLIHHQNHYLAMGISSSNQNYTEKSKIISVISLNYSGILLSPFEFFSKQNAKMSAIETSLSKIYKSILKQQHPQFSQNKKENNFKWNLGKIDQKMQQQRYSPLYNKNAGLNGNKLQCQDQFRKKWLEVFTHNIQNFKKKEPTFQYTEDNKKEAQQFDLLCYKSILSHVYGKQLKEYSYKSVSQLDAQHYMQFMNLMFGKSFLNEDKKMQKTIEAMQKQQIDIIFVQEANQKLIKKIQAMEEYTVYRKQGSDSVIVVRRKKFYNFYNMKGRYPLSYLPELDRQLSWNDDTVVAFVDNLVLISGHLSSKKDKNPQQVYDMIESLKKLHAIYPMCHVIVGCDANSFVPETLANFKKENALKLSHELETMGLKETQATNIEIYPSHITSFTTSKQRTYLQPQINKAEEIARVCRDHLIILKGQGIKINQAKVCTINNRDPIEVENLPCQQHPYDHYVVKAFIKVNVMTHLGLQTQHQK